METVEPLPGMPADSIGTANVTRRYGQAAAGVLFGFSFVWPHVKLLLLHLFFYLPLASRSRRNGNYWLAVFGKWSFTDVLVLSTLVGVFHLTVDTTAHQVWDRAAPDLIRTCETTCQEWIKMQTSGPDLDQMERAFESSFPPMAQFRRWEQGREDQMAETRRRWREYLSKRSEEMGQNLPSFTGKRSRPARNRRRMAGLTSSTTCRRPTRACRRSSTGRTRCASSSRPRLQTRCVRKVGLVWVQSNGGAGCVAMRREGEQMRRGEHRLGRWRGQDTSPPGGG